MKKYIIILGALLFLFPAVSFGATISNYANAIVNDNSYGFVAWVQSYPYPNWPWRGSTNNNLTYYLKLTDFGFSIPSNAQITDVNLHIVYHSLSASYFDRIYLVKNGIIQSTNYSFVANLGGLYQHKDINLTSENLTPTELNNSNFGIVLSSYSATTSDMYIGADPSINGGTFITITYTTPIPPPLTPKATTIPTSTAIALMAQASDQIKDTGFLAVLVLIMGIPFAFYALGRIQKIVPNDEKLTKTKSKEKSAYYDKHGTQYETKAEAKRSDKETEIKL